MTEQQWLACSLDGGTEEAEAMLTFLGPRLSRRKQVLLACASFYLHRREYDEYYPWVLQAREVAERVVDAAATPEDVARVRGAVERELADDPYPNDLMHNTLPDTGGQALNLLRLACGEYDALLDIPGTGMPYVRPFPFYGSPPREEDLIRGVFPSPFIPAPAVEPAWLSWHGDTVVKLARGIYEERAFDRMPILADALDDAGCTNESMLAHCRSSGPHIRGCWVVDRLLGKE